MQISAANHHLRLYDSLILKPSYRDPQKPDLLEKNIPAIRSAGKIAPNEHTDSAAKATKAEGQGSARPDSGKKLTEEEKKEVRELKKRDREVRAHELAHLAASGGYALGGPKFTFKTGPDGNRYAVGGEVPIDASEVPNNPRATLQKAQTVRRAALAPANPSSADRGIASKAAAMAAKAIQEMLKNQNSEANHKGNPAFAKDGQKISFNTKKALKSYQMTKITIY